MKASDKQILKVFIIITLMPLVVVTIGSAMNYIFSLVFMCPFQEIQLSCIWVGHVLFGIFFTAALLLQDHG